jgi:hypothetical protein
VGQMQEWIWLLNRQFECKKRDAGHSYQNNKGTQKKYCVWKKVSSDHANLKFKKKNKKYFKMVLCMWAVKSVIFCGFLRRLLAGTGPAYLYFNWRERIRARAI